MSTTTKKLEKLLYRESERFFTHLSISKEMAARIIKEMNELEQKVTDLQVAQKRGLSEW